MKVYLAARYNRHPEMRGVRDILRILGYVVTSRWIDCHAGKHLTSLTPEYLNTEPKYGSILAIRDLEDLAAADMVISFTDINGGGKGGRHIEFGYALALGKSMVLVGPRENIFHMLPEVEHHEDWSGLARSLTVSHSTNERSS